MQQQQLARTLYGNLAAALLEERRWAGCVHRPTGAVTAEHVPGGVSADTLRGTFIAVQWSSSNCAVHTLYTYSAEYILCIIYL